ncbi:cation:proton antiporter [Texcoconibacillus texcoconensis]|uniref:NhaP-type Na+/H+ or K+/H+ antiporter n=1 Tax=Texcoconibacillus texcoconensis TaxID=1095777 RepID=A0A840QV52_9BACI|nr:sodium:proton antiporter [Texcoconibacillus texcoconensis]MBB5175117.1 NhaP-type Na+/H+ or K+/H+ antiporter [Texcoconibacillus texcoconensis]
MHLTLLTIGIILFIGLFSQWFSWRWGLPAIFVMTITGVLFGPGLGIIDPEAAFGSVMDPLISMAVAIILFEGSLSLDRREIINFKKPVWRMITIAPLISWIFTAIATHYIMGLSWVVAFVIGGLFVVTGPTVIGPLLRQSNLQGRPAALLRWEGIIVDPIGPLFALFAFELGVSLTGAADSMHMLLFFLAAIVTSIGGYFIGYMMGYVFQKGLIPHYMQTSFMFAVIVLSFSVSNVMMPESGLLTVTAMGLAMANMGLDREILANIQHFKENISVLLISSVFIILASSVTREELMTIMDVHLLTFVLVMIFLIRPLSVWLSLIKTNLPLREKTLIGWIAPRGIVALTVSSYFQSKLVEAGFSDASLLVPLTLALVFTTVCVHGFTMTPLARSLGLAD